MRNTGILMNFYGEIKVKKKSIYVKYISKSIMLMLNYTPLNRVIKMLLYCKVNVFK